MGLFIDLLAVPVGLTNDTLEGLYKALADGHDHGDDGIWKPHDSPLVRRLIELFTQRGLTRLDSVQKELQAWHAGHRHVPSKQTIVPPGALARWNPAELSLVKLYLESLPPAKWSLTDHMMAIDYVFQRYLPEDELVKEAEWLSTRAALMGKVQANLAAPVTTQQADKILQSLPVTVAGAAVTQVVSSTLQSVLEFAALRCAESVRALADSARHRMRSIIAADLEARAFGIPPTGSSSLETKLADEFATLNRDWRRIAVTEAGEAQLQGFIASLQPGAKVKRVERYENACSFCRGIDGRVATVVAPDTPDKNPDTMIWPGKNNIGRSASPMKRVGGALVPRDKDELWWLPAGLAHPHCRGRWVPVLEDEPGDDPAFGDELRAILGSS